MSDPSPERRQLTVRELREALKGAPPDAPVHVYVDAVATGFMKRIRTGIMEPDVYYKRHYPFRAEYDSERRVARLWTGSKDWEPREA